MRRLDNRIVAYAAFVGFCVLSSLRDIVSENFFKGGAYAASPMFVLFIYSAVTQMVAGLVLLLNRANLLWMIQVLWKLKAEVFWLNISTLCAFLLYFFAISSPIGAGLNSFIDYGFGPLFTAGVGVVLIGERLDRRFALCSAISVLGVVLLALPRLIFENFSRWWFVGLLLALLSSLCSAIYRVYFKLLLTDGMTTSAVIFNRLHATTLVLGCILILDPALVQSDDVITTSLIGLLGFCVPLYLILNVIQRVTIPRLAMLLFAFPTLTLIFAVTLDYARFYWSDLVAGMITLLGLALYERQLILRKNR